jgi:hypothetical protein
MFTLILNITLIISVFETDQIFVISFYQYPEKHRKTYRGLVIVVRDDPLREKIKISGK